MANAYGLFWNSISSDRVYDADSFAEWLNKFFTTGVFNGELQVLSSGGMVVEVQTGYANINGKVRFFDTTDSITLDPAGGTYPRIDTIVIERNDTNREITIEYVKGTYSGNTPTPTAPVRSAGVYQIVLAQIYVGAGVTEISQANITDTRADNNLCGWIVGTVDRVDVDQMTAQVQDEIETWFDGMKNQLSEDAAIHLQEQIGTLSQLTTTDKTDLVSAINEVNSVTETTITLAAASWVSDIYTISDASIDPAKEIILTYDPTLTDAEYKAYQKADVRPWGAVSAGSMQLKAVGGAPSVDLDMVLIVR